MNNTQAIREILAVTTTKATHRHHHHRRRRGRGRGGRRGRRARSRHHLTIIMLVGAIVVAVSHRVSLAMTAIPKCAKWYS